MASTSQNWSGIIKCGSRDRYENVWLLVHKRVSILAFEGLSTTFEALANVLLLTFVIYIYC